MDKGKRFYIDASIDHKNGRYTAVTNEKQFESKLRILIIENDPIMEDVHNILIENLGFKVDVAKNTAEALTLFNKNNYDLILMDLELPEVNTIKIAAEIRRHEMKSQYIPIIAIINDITHDVRTQYLSIGFSEIIKKPLQEKALKKLLKKFFKTRK